MTTATTTTSRHSGGLNIDTVDLSKPFLYHQPALSFVFSGPLSTRRLPTQLVFPDGRIAIGTTSNVWSQSGGGGEVEEDEARINRLRSDTVIAYACVPETQSFEPPLKTLAIFLLLFIMFQILWIAVVLSGKMSSLKTRYPALYLGGYLFPFGTSSLLDTRSSDAFDGGSLQHAVYTNILILHILPIIGVLYRFPLALFIYNVMQFVNFALTFTCCLYSVLDILVLASIVPIRIIAGKIETLMVRIHSSRCPKSSHYAKLEASRFNPNAVSLPIIAHLLSGLTRCKQSLSVRHLWLSRFCLTIPILLILQYFLTGVSSHASLPQFRQHL